MIDLIKETLIDVIKLIPFLLITYFIMEYIEHKTSKKAKESIKKARKMGANMGKSTRNISTMSDFQHQRQIYMQEE